MPVSIIACSLTACRQCGACHRMNAACQSINAVQPCSTQQHGARSGCVSCADANAAARTSNTSACVLAGPQTSLNSNLRCRSRAVSCTVTAPASSGCSTTAASSSVVLGRTRQMTRMLPRNTCTPHAHLMSSIMQTHVNTTTVRSRCALIQRRHGMRSSIRSRAPRQGQLRMHAFIARGSAIKAGALAKTSSTLGVHAERGGATSKEAPLGVGCGADRSSTLCRCAWHNEQ